MKAVRIHEFGDLDVLKWEETPTPKPSPHQVLIKVDSSGVNYADIMRRRGGYPGPDLPSTLGLEAAGTIIELGSDVVGLTEGQRVMAMGPQGHAEYVAVNANLVFTQQAVEGLAKDKWRYTFMPREGEVVMGFVSAIYPTDHPTLPEPDDS